MSVEFVDSVTFRMAPFGIIQIMIYVKRFHNVTLNFSNVLVFNYDIKKVLHFPVLEIMLVCKRFHNITLNSYNDLIINTCNKKVVQRFSSR